jgi:hypothetical protein
VRAAQRRSLKESGEPVFKAGALCVDFSSRQVKLDRKEIKLTPTEYSLLRVLVQNAGKVVTHRQLLRTVWGEKAESQAQYLRVYVTHLRKKLDPDDPAFAESAGVNNLLALGRCILINGQRAVGGTFAHANDRGWTDPRARNDAAKPAGHRQLAHGSA